MGAAEEILAGHELAAHELATHELAHELASHELAHELASHELPDAKPVGGLLPRLGAVDAGLEAAVRELPAAILLELPRPVCLGLHVPGVPGVIRVGADPSAADEGELTLAPDEWAALVAGAEADRVWPAHLRAALAQKRAEPATRLDREWALAGAQPDPAERWTAGQVLERVGATLLSIDL